MKLPVPSPERIEQFLKTLLAIDSPVGDTVEIERHMEALMQSYAIPVTKTQRGNLLAYVGGDQPQRALAAHIDTLGAMVQAILPNGRLALTPLGCWSSRFAEGARVTLKTDNGSFRGTILPKLSSGHAYNEAVDQQPVAWSQVELRLDVSSFSAEQTREWGVQPGDIVCVDPQPEFTQNGFLVSRYLDNKASVACILELLHLLQEQPVAIKVPFVLVFSNAEEVGLGAGTALSSSGLTAELKEFVSVDIAPVAANQNSHEGQAVIGYKDELGPHDRRLLQHLSRLAQHHNIAATRDVFRFYHSDCSSVLRAGHDVRSALLGFGTDSTHGYERTHMDSLLALTQLLWAYVTSDIDASN